MLHLILLLFVVYLVILTLNITLGALFMPRGNPNEDQHIDISKYGNGE